METAYQNCVKRFVHVSSVGVYGNIKKWPADEEAPCKPQNIYGETKLAGELAVKKYRDDTGLPVVILRPAWVYGPGCPRTLKIYRALRRGHFIMIGKGDNLRHPLYIQDMLSAFIRAMEADSAVGETFIVGGRHAFSTAELINSFCNVFDLSRPKIRLPMILGKIAVSGVELIFNLAGKNPPVSKRSLEFFQANNSFDIGKAKKILNFSPKFSFEDGLRETQNWLESHDSS
jgi:nucleoside-diphosphate-sugar epimerase